MEITEIRVKLVGNPKERLKAVCSITIDGEFVIRDMKVIEGSSGLFVAMPSRKLADHCPKCRAKNHLRARFCGECGNKLEGGRASRDRSGRMKLHADVAHPINSDCRNRIQSQVIEAYEAELEKSQKPGYEPVEYEDDDEDSSFSEYDELIADLKKDAAKRQRDRAEKDAARYGGLADETDSADEDEDEDEYEDEDEDEYEEDEFETEAEEEDSAVFADADKRERESSAAGGGEDKDDDSFGAGIL